MARSSVEHTCDYTRGYCASKPSGNSSPNQAARSASTTGTSSRTQWISSGSAQIASKHRPWSCRSSRLDRASSWTRTCSQNNQPSERSMKACILKHHSLPVLGEAVAHDVDGRLCRCRLSLRTPTMADSCETQSVDSQPPVRTWGSSLRLACTFRVVWPSIDAVICWFRMRTGGVFAVVPFATEGLVVSSSTPSCGPH